MKAGEKYNVPSNEGEWEVLPNLKGLKTKQEIDEFEVASFAKAEIILTQSLTDETLFHLKYIYAIHKTAFEELYSFAGNLRTVNMSKGGFPFPAAKFLPQAMQQFEKEVLTILPNKYNNKSDLIKDIAKVHGELLYIHPFREGNGRTARLLANLMSYKAGYSRLQFELLNNEVKFKDYITAVQKVAEQNYSYMEKIISFVFAG